MSTPSAFLQNLIGRPVVVKLNSGFRIVSIIAIFFYLKEQSAFKLLFSLGVDYRGVLVCLDGYMNIALEQVIEA